MNLLVNSYISRLLTLTLLLGAIAFELSARQPFPVVESGEIHTEGYCEIFSTGESFQMPVSNAVLAKRPLKRILDRMALKTNLLYYAILMPNIEFEWKFAEKWSAALEVQAAWYSKKHPYKVYRVAAVTPEVRYWFIDRSAWHGLYGGVFFGLVPYDLCNGKKGHEGDGFMAGLSAGYMWRISHRFSLDTSLGLGYFHANDKEYLPADNHYLYQLTKKIGYFGPLRLKLSLVYLFNADK